MKRLAVLLALVMTVGLVGCGNSDTQSKTETKSERAEEQRCILSNSAKEICFTRQSRWKAWKMGYTRMGDIRMNLTYYSPKRTALRGLAMWTL